MVCYDPADAGQTPIINAEAVIRVGSRKDFLGPPRPATRNAAETWTGICGILPSADVEKPSHASGDWSFENHVLRSVDISRNPLLCPRKPGHPSFHLTFCRCAEGQARPDLLPAVLTVCGGTGNRPANDSQIFVRLSRACRDERALSLLHRTCCKG